MNYKIISLVLLGLFIRFIYFPSDISFQYDQARDAFASQEIMAGHLKILGPAASMPGINHGVLAYYIFGPLYALSHGNPELVAGFIRTLNALGVIVVFLVARKLFNSKTGLIAAVVFAVSFEQSQFSLFLGHPALAVVPVLFFYYGLISKRFILAAVALGLAIQFHFAMLGLLPIFLFWLIANRPTLKTLLKITLAFILTLSSFILAELKFGFRMTHTLLQASSGQSFNLYKFPYILQRFVTDNGLVVFWLFPIVLLFLLPKHKLLLFSWLAGGFVPYLFDHSTLPIYYYTICGSVSLIIVIAYYLSRLPRFATAITLALIIFANLSLITKFNSHGVIPAISVQSGMLLSDEKAVIDYLYTHNDQNFAVNAITIPYGINTTWSYLLEIYGKTKYGYLPVWSAESALGYPGNLQVQTNRSQLPTNRFTILEPNRGLDQRLIDSYLQNENYFTKVINEKQIGDFVIQTRQSI